MSKTIIYQLLPRFYTNTCEANKKGGTLAENGCGKMNEINEEALGHIASLGVSHVWYTGIIRHASTTRYPFMSHPSNNNVVKGKAGSPYAICDYYDVDPDLAQDVDRRMDEWKELVERTHRHGMKVLVDFVPNHVARGYYSDARPDTQLGSSDDTTKAFSPGNNFYYLPGHDFTSPVADLDEPYVERPAKASGNDAFSPCPSVFDWYETVKLNYGRDYATGGGDYFSPRPDTWNKMRDIMLFWVQTGIDGFRVDMAHMVPVEFWRWVIAQIVNRHPHIIFVGEIYETGKYAEFIDAGFNILYDKVNFYDIVRDVTTGRAPASAITEIWRRTGRVLPNMLYFLENHDEQRIASDFFLSNPLLAKPAYLLALTMGRGATMMYAGQEFGERGMDDEGYSDRNGRTSIFDYWSVSSLRRNARGGTFDGAALEPLERQVRDWYVKVNAVAQRYEALSVGDFYDLMWINQHIWVDAANVYAFLRYLPGQRFLVVLNFAATPRRQNLMIPEDAWRLMGSTWNECITAYDVLGSSIGVCRDSINNIKVRGLEIEIPANDGLILRI